MNTNPPSTRPLRVGIEWGFDTASVAHGQFRYVVDLLTALNSLGTDDQFVIFGTRPVPPADIAQLFADRDARWTWHHKPTATCRGSYWLNQWRGFWTHRGRSMDLLHCIDSLIPEFPPCPVVATAYDIMMEVFPDDYAEWLRSKGYKRIRRLSQRTVSLHLAISRTTASDYTKFWGIPTERIRVVYLGTAGFRPPCADGKSTLVDRFPDLPARFVLSPYNLEPRKNLRTLLSAFPAVLKRYPDVRLVLFGRAGWTREREAEFERQTASLGLGNAVLRLGIVSDPELAALYQIAEVCAFPTLYEGFGLPILEAMAVGGCVLAHEASSMAEIVGPAGQMVNVSDTAAVAARLIDLLGNANQCTRLREAAVKRAADFTAERMARETLSVYREAASYASRGPRALKQHGRVGSSGDL